MGTKADDMAFPKGVSGYEGHQGLTKREYFAAMAMQGLLSNPEMARVLKQVGKHEKHSSIAETAVIAADTLIKQLNASH